MLNKITGVTAAAVVGIAAAVAGAQNTAVQWKVEDGGNGHWYAGCLLSSNFTWSNALANARAAGGDLASIASVAESQWVYLYIADDPSLWSIEGAFVVGPWFGGRGKDGIWSWTDGSEWSYTEWYPNEGDYSTFEQYTHYYSGFGSQIRTDSRWANFWSEPMSRSYVVEWSTDCNNDNIVDYGQCHDGTLADYNGNNIPDCCELGETCVVSSYPVQWRVEDGGNGHWYDQQTWIGPKSIVDISASYVALIGAHAVTITSASENEFVYRAVHSRTSDATHAGYSILGGYQDVGASDYSEPAGGWRWVTGEPMTYLNWGPGFPDNCCYGESVLQYPSASYWNDAETAGVPAGHRYRVIIEWEADCNNDNIVDYGQILTGQLADSNTNGIPDICEQPQCQDADITNNQIIDGADLGALLAFWGPVNPVLPQADVNRDGQVNGADIGILLSYWGPCP